MANKKLAPVLCIAALLAIGFFLMWFGWKNERTDLLLDQRNAVIEGKVIDEFKTSSTKAGTWSHLVVEYQPPNHAPITKEFYVDGAAYSVAIETRKATVTYLPEDPTISRVTKFDQVPYQILKWFGVVISLGNLILLVKFLKSRQKLT
ncbi:MAG: hypothetical protein EBQ96_08655 [Proteobacteria bacterium]|nr:hypothetical protein [Pseudomonadota bacterium]